MPFTQVPTYAPNIASLQGNSLWAQKVMLNPPPKKKQQQPRNQERKKNQQQKHKKPNKHKKTQKPNQNRAVDSGLHLAGGAGLAGRALGPQLAGGARRAHHRPAQRQGRRSAAAREREGSEPSWKTTRKSCGVCVYGEEPKRVSVFCGSLKYNVGFAYTSWMGSPLWYHRKGYSTHPCWLSPLPLDSDRTRTRGCVRWGGVESEAKENPIQVALFFELIPETLLENFLDTLWPFKC